MNGSQVGRQRAIIVPDIRQVWVFLHNQLGFNNIAKHSNCMKCCIAKVVGQSQCCIGVIFKKNPRPWSMAMWSGRGTFDFGVMSVVILPGMS
ncbi:unnamed protein product [Camellia sinensis]